MYGFLVNIDFHVLNWIVKPVCESIVMTNKIFKLAYVVRPSQYCLIDKNQPSIGGNLFEGDISEDISFEKNDF